MSEIVLLSTKSNKFQRTKCILQISFRLKNSYPNLLPLYGTNRYLNYY
ncbi:hypothetical protein T01_11048 [Trichinella spiralis]|uniref:Uncharacterized protein n=1 Tax=Trichinella spiralis TaxID=6334 RepID=A0A0V1AH46_TRISP|nr:hypothetical protein T01_11048 [Trichinella spiralis]